MAEEKEKVKAKGKEKKNDAGEKLAGGGKNDDDDGGIATIILKLDLHCEGCAKKVRRSVRHFEGVEDVKADYRTGKLTVKGNVDPLWLRETVERKTKKKVALLSAQPKIDGGAGSGGGEKKSDEKVEKKVEEKKNKSEDKNPKKAQLNTEVAGVHCDGGARKIKRFIIRKLTPYLKYKGKRNVKAVPPKQKGNGSGVGGGDGGNKKKKEVAHGGGGGDGGGESGKKKGGESTVASKSTEAKEKKAEVMNKTEYYYGYSNNPNAYYHAMPLPMYNQNYTNQDYGVAMQDHGYYYNGYTSYAPRPPPPRDYGYYSHTGYVSPRHLATTSSGHGYGYGYNGYVPPPYIAPQYFSDENPSACSVM